MLFLGLGAMIALAGSWPVLFARAGVKTFALTFAAQFLFWSFCVWLNPFQTAGPLLGQSLHSRFFFSALFTCALATVVFARTMDDDVDAKISRVAGAVAKHSGVTSLVYLALVAFTYVAMTSPMFHAAEYRAFAADGIAEGTWNADVSPVDPAHLRQVSLSQATWKGNKALSQVEGGSLGSRFRIGEYQIQKYRDELMWIAPLEYQSATVWSSADFSPGFVMVSAEDPDREPKLVSDRKMRYLDGAYLWDNLWRHVVGSGYGTRGLMDPTFEVDDDGNPFFVYTRYDLAVGYDGAVPVGALVVDPETGAMKEYALADLPPWIDRIMPESEAVARLGWYGDYVNGWFNSVWSKRDVIKPTDSDLSLVWTDDGRACWFSGMTSTASTDNALVSIVLMDSRTGLVREYKVNGAADEEDVNGAVKSAVSNFKDWVPTPAIPENVYGQLAWIVPIVNGDGVPQRIAIVSADASKVALGENVKQALAEFRRKMSEGGERVVAGDTGTEETAQAVVERFAADVRGGNTTYLFTLAGDARVFTGTGDVSPELSLTRVGDAVTVGFLETEEATVPVQRFDNLAIATRDPVQEQRLEEIGKSLYAPQPQ
ncbi:MAG: hypothetical protein WCO25_04895 [Candidatus Uhrbacteria bacterium]